MNLQKRICAYILAMIMVLGHILSNGLMVKAAAYDMELTVGDSKYMDEQWVNDGVTSSDPNVAIAVKDNNYNGQVKITGVAPGTATISYSHWTGNHTVTVKVSSVPVTGLTLSSSAIDLAVGHTTRVLATFTPKNATNKTLQWTSADPSKVSVDRDTGVIKGVAVTGTAGVLVTATTVSGAGVGDNTHSASVTVRVGEPKTTWMKDTSHNFVDGQKYVFVSNDYVFYGSEGLLSSDMVQIEGNGVLANVANQLTTWTYSAVNNGFTSVDGVTLDNLTGLKGLQYITSGETLVLKGECAPDNNPYWTNAPHYIALENGQFIKKQDSNGYSGHSYPEQYLFTVYKEVPIKSELTAQFYMVDNVNQIGKEGMELIGTETGTCQTAQGMRYDMPWYDDASWDAKYKNKAIAAVSVNGTLYSGSQLSNLKIYPGIDKDIKYYFYSSNAVTVKAEFYFVDSVGVITDEHLSTPNPESHHYLGDAEALLDRKTTGNLLKNPLAIFNLTKESDIYKTLQQKDALDYLYEVRSSKEIRSTYSSHVRQWIYAAVRSNANNYIPAETHLHVDTANPPLNLKDAEVSLQVNELDGQGEQYVIKYIFHKKLTVPIEYYYQDEQGNEVLLAKSYTPKENWTHICPPMFNQNPFVKGTGEKEFNLQGAQKTFSDQERLALMNRCMKFYVGDTLIKTVNGVLDRVELTDDEADKFVGNDIKLKIYYSDPIKVTLNYYWPSDNSDSLTLQRTEEKTADSNSVVAISSLSQLNHNSTGLSKYHTHLYNANGEKIREIPGVPDELQITEAGSTFTLHIHYVKAPEVTIEYYFMELDDRGRENPQLLGRVNKTIVADVDDKVNIPDFNGYLDLSKVSVVGQPNWTGTETWPENAKKDRTQLVDKYVRQYSPDNQLVWTTQGVPDEVQIVGEGNAFTLKVYLVNPAVPTSNVLQLPVTIRDFRGDGILFEYNYDSNHLSRRYNLYGVEGTGHPNGEGSERTTGLVENELRNGKIVYKEATIRYVAQLLYAGIYNDNPFDRYTKVIGHIFDVIEEGKEQSEKDAMGSMNTVNAALAVDGEVGYEDIKDAYTAAYYLLSHMWDDDGVDANDNLDDVNAYKEYNMIIPEVRAIQFQQYTDGVDKYFEYNSHEYETVLVDGIIKNTQNAPEATPYDDLCYHPIDGLGYGNVNQDQTLVTSGADKLHDYNYLFTTMGQGQFVFSAAKNLYFEFNGDDDVYLFIDGKLVLDNGGAHQKENAIVYLNDINGTVLNLEEGKSYDFTFFHAERRSTGSHFHIKTNIEVMDSAVLTEKHVYQDKVDRIDGNVVDKDQPVVYGFEMINHGSSHVFHLALEDESLGIRLYAKGSSKPCKFNGIADKESVETGYATEVGQKLSNEILPGNIEITITELDKNGEIFYPKVVRYEFIQKENTDSTLGNWWPSYDSNDNLIVDTNMSTYGQFKETKLKDKFRELYGREGTQEEYIALLQEILLNGLEPTQRILIKRFNRTMDANETYTNRVNTFATNIVEQKIVGTASITVRTLDIENRIFVIDYGKKVHFHEDQIFTDAEMKDTWLKLDVSTSDTPNWKIISENPEVVGKFGTATLGEEDNKTKYFQYELDRYMSASEAFKIGVESRVDESEPGTHETLVKTITMMPASNVYYEDDFDSKVVSQTLNVQQDTEYISQSGIVYQGNWRRVQIDAEGNDSDAGEGNITYQEGKETKGDNPYGYDTNYDNQTTFSDGTAWVADVSNGVARAYFEFQGNGFDLYSRTNSNTALIYVNLFQKQIDGSWKAIDLVTVDTLYKIGDLYQVPIVSYNKHNLSSLRYGTYRVQLMVMKKAANANEGTSARTLFYLDGIRIYNPAGTSVETEVEYAKNNEANATYTEIRDILLSAPEGDGVLKGNGAVFIDSLETETDGQIVSKVATYESFGPKNEVYLNDGKNEAGVTQTGAIAFGITYKEGMALQIGARSPENLAGNPSIQVTVTKNSDTGVQTKKIIPIKSTADMYYPIAIPEGVTTGDELTISIINNSGLDGTEIEKGDHFIALTKLKQSFDSITHTANTYSVTPETTQIATEGVKRFMLMRRMVNIPENPEESQPEVPQPEVMQPEVPQPDVIQPEVSKPEVSIQEEPKPEVQQSTVPQQEVQQSTVSQTELQKPTVPQQEIQQEEEKKPAKQQSEQQKTETKGFFRIILEFLLELLSNIKEWLGIGGEK